jgi:formate dehydrogenase accessory protein FdhD
LSDALARLLELVAAEEGLSTARACKRLGLSRSELQRLLVALGPEASLGGLDLVRVESANNLDTLWLTAKARAARSGGFVPLRDRDALRLSEAGSEAVTETLAEEVPVALIYNGVPHVVMMATPADLEDFAVGFSLTEGIVDDAGELQIVEMLQRDRGVAIHLMIPGVRFEALEGRRRSLVGRTGCGLCGAEALETAVRPVRRIESNAKLSRAELSAAFARLARSQPLNESCGALHAAAAILRANADLSVAVAEIGEALLVREDVGRHNALDKVIGALARSNRDARALLVTSRASYELVHKTAAANMPILAAVSAPTAYAVRLAEEAGVTLAAFVRDGRMTVYSQPDRIQPN